MNAKRMRLRILAARASGLYALASQLAYGGSLPDVLDDPLLSRPPALERGMLLPAAAQPVTCPAAVDLARPLGLMDAVDLGLCNNPQASHAWATIKVQAAALGQARAAYLPNASVSVSRLHTGTQYPGFPNAAMTTNGHTVNAGMSWRLFDFGARAANRAAADYGLQAALASHDATLQKIMSDVIDAYYAARAASAALAARAESTLLAQDTLAATLRRQQKGIASQSDTLQAATALASAKLAEQRARADYEKARAILLYVLGIRPSTSLQLSSADAAEHGNAVGDLQHWLEEAEARHPEIVAAKAQWNAAQARIASARAEGLPTIDATANFYQNGYPNQGLQPTRSNIKSVGVSLTIPLFEGLARTYKVRTAQAQAEQSEAQLANTQNQVLTDVIKAHAEAVSAAANLQASLDLLQAAQAAMASARRRYNGGAADILELLSTQSALANAQQERVRAWTEWEAGRLKLVAATGTLGAGWLANE